MNLTIEELEAMMGDGKGVELKPDGSINVIGTEHKIINKEENNMKKYIGSKIIKAEPMDGIEFKTKVKKETLPDGDQQTRPGYLVIYPDGYKSWSPKEVFETAYREITKDEEEIIRGIDCCNEQE